MAEAYERPALLVVGAGPAGLAAAAAAREHRAAVVLLDASDELGGQYWRHLPAQRPARREAVLHHGWNTFTRLRDRLLDDPGCEVLTGAQVWSVEARDAVPPRVNVLLGPADDAGRRVRRFAPGAVVFATGAQERVLPFPGWELPGVFTAGAAQALAKGERVAIGERVLVAGAGPFLLPVASSLLRTGARVVEVAEASTVSRMGRGWSARPWQLLGSASKVGELAGYVADLARHRVPYRTATGAVAAHGADRLEAVTLASLAPDWSPIPGTERTLEVDAVCVGHGFTPRAELALAAGCEADPDGTVVVDEHQRTSVPRVYAAGELTGIGGADLALSEGDVAGRAAVGADVPPARVRARASQRAFADRLEAAHGIRPGWQHWVEPGTVVCRCEDVTAGDLARVAEHTGSRGLRSLRLNSRAGLGVCQGRTCGRNVEELLGAQLPDGLLDPGRHAARPLSGTIRLADLARTDTPTLPPSSVHLSAQSRPEVPETCTLEGEMPGTRPPETPPTREDPSR